MLHQLSGSEGLIPTITEANCNTKTLLAFAHQTPALHGEVSALKQDNQELLAKIALLETQLAQTKKTSIGGPNPQSLFGASTAAIGSAGTQNDSDPKGKNGP